MESTQEYVLLVALIMVKNEGDGIVNILKQYVDGDVTNFLIYDMGSTDSTLTCIRNYFQDILDVTYFIIEEPLTESSSINLELGHLTEQINQAINHVKRLFNTVFILIPDSAFYIHSLHELLIFCKDNLNSEEEIYYLNVKVNDLTLQQNRLIRSNLKYYTPSREGINFVPSECFFEVV